MEANTDYVLPKMASSFRKYEAQNSIFAYLEHLDYY